MIDHDRPLSPHLSVYRWPITMTLSILHRATGVALSVGFIVLGIWLASVAAGPTAAEQVNALLGSTLGRLMLIAWSAAFFFHLANGIRHLFWDAGMGFEKSQANASAWFVVALTILLTAAFWWLL